MRTNRSGIDWSNKEQVSAYYAKKHAERRKADIEIYFAELDKNAERRKKKRIEKRIRYFQNFHYSIRGRAQSLFLKREIARMMARGKSVGDMVPLLMRPYSIIQKFYNEILAEKGQAPVLPLPQMAGGIPAVGDNQVHQGPS